MRTLVRPVVGARARHPEEVAGVGNGPSPLGSQGLHYAALVHASDAPADPAGGDPPPPADPPARRVRPAVRLFVVAWLAVQLVVPTVLLLERPTPWFTAGDPDVHTDGSRSSRFAWHMFSTVQSSNELQVVLADGRTTTVRSVDLRGEWNGRMVYHPSFGEQVCGDVPGAEVVRWHSGWSTWSHRC